METSSKKVLAALPDFDAFMAIAQEIKKLYHSKMILENEIKTSESNAFKAVMTDPKYFNNGKTVSVSYFENLYKHKGLENETLELRQKLADVVSELDLKRSQFEIYKQMHDLYKTLVYQEKNMS